MTNFLELRYCLNQNLQNFRIDTTFPHCLNQNLQNFRIDLIIFSILKIL